MNSRRRSLLSAGEWLLLAAVAGVFFAAWLKFGYPQLAAIDLSVGRRQAVRQAEQFLGKRGVDCGRYRKIVVFDSDEWSDTYLQKTLGPAQEEVFFRDHGYELFSWKVRFFRQFEKEEYVVEVSPSSGRIIAFEHKIPDTEERPAPVRDAAAGRATAFLKETGLDLSAFDFNEEKAKRFDKRTDYSFSWEKKGIYIPWEQGKGGAKLITDVTISGAEVLEFRFNRLDLPEDFYRYIDRQMFFGEYISSLSQLLFAVFIIFALVVLIGRRATVLIRYIRGRILTAAAVLAAVYFLFQVNNVEYILSGYSTSTSLSSFLGIYFLQSLMGIFFLGVVFAVPALSGESLLSAEFPGLRRFSLTHYLLSSWFARSTSFLVAMGYLLFLILLGLQATLFSLGQEYLGVWKQWIKLTQFSSAFLPFFSAFAVGLTASLTEEAVFRLFGITWGKKVFRSTLVAVIFASLVWGFGHTQYPIFPVWFRGIEVSIIGLVYGLVFLRYGIIPLVVAHYLFDVFWGVSPYILGKSPAYLFAGSLVVLLLPLAFAVAAFIKNRNEEERQVELLLDPAQKFNLGVLASFVRERRAAGDSREAVRRQLLAHHWDESLVNLALKGEYGTDG